MNKMVNKMAVKGKKRTRGKKRRRKREKDGSMKKFEFLDIAPADAAFVAYGRNLNEVFANAALAVFEIITETKKVGTVQKITVDVSGYDLKSLMFAWLNELLFISSSESLVFSKFEVGVEEKDKERVSLKAACYGEKMNPSKHEIRAEVKAITYHKMEIKKEGDIWKAQVIVDL